VIFNGKTSYKIKVLGVVLLVNMSGIAPANATVATPPESATVEAQEPRTDLNTYRGRTLLTDTELVSLLSLVGFKGSNLKLAWAIVMRESTGRPTSRNLTHSTGDNSYGLFQINMVGSLGADRRDKFGIKIDRELLDPVTNAEAAFYMSNRGTDFASWGLGPNAYDGTASEPAVTMWLKKFPK